jgi:hypothetical protein
MPHPARETGSHPSGSRSSCPQSRSPPAAASAGNRHTALRCAAPSRTIRTTARARRTARSSTMACTARVPKPAANPPSTPASARPVTQPTPPAPPAPATRANPPLCVADAQAHPHVVAVGNLRPKPLGARGFLSSQSMAQISATLVAEHSTLRGAKSARVMSASHQFLVFSDNSFLNAAANSSC